jgi:CRISPR-associated endonuclease/helicase Cas3
LEGGKRVLWVLNTVARCQEVACRLTKSFPDNQILCYHSRFRLKDRRRRHQEVIDLFRAERQPAIVVSTQVCEMSLDLDADVLITEAAGVPALIQRMGRCCREPLPSPGRFGDIYVYPPRAPLPYTAQEIADGAAFAQALDAVAPVTHDDLARYLAEMPGRDQYATGGFTGFLDSGWYAMSRDDSFREDDDYAVDGVLDSDVEAYLAAQRQQTGRDLGFIVPVPRRMGRRDARLGPWVRVADSLRYTEELGFLVGEVEQSG